MPYNYHTDEDRRAMLEFLGLRSEDELFEGIPERYLLHELLPMEKGLTEPETMRMFAEIAETNTSASGLVSFLGGGIYEHTVPSVVRNISSRPEFATAYTPYQPEVSQGTLQVIFEFQTHISRLTGMAVANASMYDGASAVAEACLMAAKIARRDVILYPENLNPRYLRVVRRYVEGQKITLTPVPHTAAGDIDGGALRERLSDRVAGVIVQTPNYFGLLERPWDYAEDVRAGGALLIAAVDPISLALFRAPASYGADIVVGEAQSLGNEMNFGGPVLGFMACAQQHIRQMPGRIVSATKDVDGKDAFVLTLQTREQHIRREKATSNICTNQGLLATRATIYLSLLGESGLSELAKICHAKAHRLAEMATRIGGYTVRFAAPFFREFVLECPVDADTVCKEARAQGILAGIAMKKYFGERGSNSLLVAVTEKHNDGDFERFCSVLEDAAQKIGK